MNVTHKVAFAPGEDPVTLLIIPPPESGMAPFYLADATQSALQALAPAGVPWSDAESRAVAQALLDEHPRSALVGGMTIVIPGDTP